MAHPEIVEWIQTAPGVALNPDQRFGLQCVDAVDQYGQDIFQIPWNVCVGGVAGAKQLLDVAPDEYWIRIDNDPARPDQLPVQGDVVVFGGSYLNEWGHTAIVDTADQNGMWVVQQDGFAAPLIQTPDGVFSNKPAHRAWLNYYSPGTGMILGWLRPRENKLAGYTAPAPAPVPQPVALLPYQRETQPVDFVAYRKTPSVHGDLIQWLDPGKVYDFKGYVVREDRVWFVGRYSGGFSWNGGFLDEGVHDLPDLTNELFPAPAPTPPPLPTPEPTPVPAPEPTSTFLHGIDVAVYQEQGDLSVVPGAFVIIKATEGGGDWTDKALASNVAEARRANKLVGFYHFARPLATAGNTAAEEARSFLKAIEPYVEIGDRLFLDWEAENQDRTDWAEEWLDIVAAASDSLPLIYLNSAAINGGDWSRVEAKYPLWYAGGKHYNEQTGYVSHFKEEAQVTWEKGVWMWQYTSNGKLDGYSGALDLNVWYGDELDWTIGGIGDFQEPTPAPEPEPTPTPQPPVEEGPIEVSERDILIRYATAQIDAYLANRG